MGGGCGSDRKSCDCINEVVSNGKCIWARRKILKRGQFSINVQIKLMNVLLRIEEILLLLKEI